MLLLRSRHLWLVLLVTSIATALPPAKSGNDVAGRATALVKQLGDDEFAKREAAGAELRRLGEKGLPAVRTAAGSENPEIRYRAHTILNRILSDVRTSRSTNLEMRPIHGRGFVMGSPNTEPARRPDETRHPARITGTFLIGVHEVTQAEYQQVMNHNPSWFTKTGGGKEKVAGDTGRFPVEQVTWFDAVEFCNRLSKLDGYEPYYALADVETEDESITDATVTVAGGTGYRLPTEAEWEYVCRAGTDTPFHFGPRSTGRELNAKIITPGGYGGPGPTVQLGRTSPVASYPRNAFGLHDTHGNVAEWCQDWYHRDYYATTPENGPTGPKTGTHRVVRGGSWLVTDTSCRSAARGFQLPGEASFSTGFRVARTP